LTDKKTKAKNKNVSPNKKISSSRNKIIPNIEKYLTYDLQNRNFENNTLKSTSSVAIESLVNTGDIKHLRVLSTIKSIYQEEVFWDQLFQWNKLAFYGDKNAEMLLETVVKGVRNAIITYKSKRTGRPSKSLSPEIDIIEEYSKVQQELLKHAIIDYPKKDIDKYCSEVEKGIGSKQNPQLVNVIQVNIERRKRNLTTFLQEKELKFSKREFDKMVNNSNSEISIKLLSKQYDVGTKMIKELLASEDPRHKMIINITLTDSNIIPIDYDQLCKERIALADCKDENSYQRILSERLGVPIEALQILKTVGGPVSFPRIRTPSKK